MAVPPTDTVSSKTQILQLAQTWRRLAEDRAPDAETEEQKRELIGQLNAAYWNHLFQRLEGIVTAAADRQLTFAPGDLALFDLGLIDESPDPAILAELGKPYRDGEFTVLSLSEWLAFQDDRFMQIPLRDRLAERISQSSGTIESVNREVLRLQDERGKWLNGALAQRVLVDLNEHEAAHLSIYLFEKARRKRSLTGAEARTYSQNRAVVARSLTLICRGVGPDGEREVPKLTQEIIRLRQRLSDLREDLEALQRERDSVDERGRTVAIERRLQMESWLREVKENTELCSKFGRCLYSPLLLGGQGIVKRADIVETVKTVESWDPALFRNRRVEKEGIPPILMTPGNGNGSYDYRTNTLVVPVTTPTSLLESVAFALALYRRDIDKTESEGKLWESFFDEDVWRKAEIKRPTGIRDRMNVFVAKYCQWIVKETRGHSVLEEAIREWFELSIAPDRRRPILPRELRRVRVDDIENLRRRYGEDPTAPHLYCHAVLSFRIEEYDAALESATQSVKMDATQADPFWLLGLLYMLDDQTLRETRSETLRGMGRLERRKHAKQAFQVYLKLAPQSWWSQKAQGYLREIDFDLSMRKK